MLLSAVSVLVVVQSSSEIPEGLMNNPVLFSIRSYITLQYQFSGNYFWLDISHHQALYLKILQRTFYYCKER